MYAVSKQLASKNYFLSGKQKQLNQKISQQLVHVATKWDADFQIFQIRRKSIVSVFENIWIRVDRAVSVFFRN